MATAAMDTIIFSNNQPQCLSGESNVNCANCILVKEQLHFTVLELKSARTIISLLRDDINKAIATDATKISKPSLSCEMSVYEQVGDEWIPVVYSFNKKMKTPILTPMRTKQHIASLNCFTLLATLNNNLAYEVRQTSNSEWSSSTKSTDKSTNHPSDGNKVLTIINGRDTNGDIKKPSRTLVNSSHAPDNNSKYDHKVKIIGDSHLKGSAARINQYLNTKFKVCNFIKPGAHTNQLVHSQEMEFKRLG